MIAGFVAGLGPATDAWASEASEVEALRREVAQMRVQVQALQTALAEPTDGERHRPTAESAPPPPAAPAPTGDATNAAGAPAAPPAAGTDKKRRRSSKQRQRRSGRARSAL